MNLIAEIHQQAQVLAGLFETQMDGVEQIARALREKPPGYVLIAARGTSDNAGRYANYVWGSLNGLPVALAAPSLFSIYQQPPRLKDALVVGISQSGQSPDIVSVLAEARRQGTRTLAIVNAPDSPLAAYADWVIDIHAGEERAVAATKTYTAQLMVIAMLAAALQADPELKKSLAQVSGWVQDILDREEQILRLAERYRYMERCVVLGRGYNYATAFEWSLKLKELCYVVAEPYSSADFLHGPIAIVEPGFPVMAVAPSGKVFDSFLSLLQQLRQKQSAEVVLISDRDQALALAQSPVKLPLGIPEWLSPLVAIVPAQIFTYSLTQVKGFSTESPRSIRKVTETR
jgi:glutamine---fructose-6-phosphate transaminase (isomerizing)